MIVASVGFLMLFASLTGGGMNIGTIIDSFIVPQHSMPNETIECTLKIDSEFYCGRLPFLFSLAFVKPEHSLRLAFEAKNESISMIQIKEISATQNEIVKAIPVVKEKISFGGSATTQNRVIDFPLIITGRSPVIDLTVRGIISRHETQEEMPFELTYTIESKKKFVWFTSWPYIFDSYPPPSLGGLK